MASAYQQFIMQRGFLRRGLGGVIGRWQSSGAAAASASSPTLSLLPPTIISRRAWQAYQKAHLLPVMSHKSTSSGKKKKDNTSWPRSMKIFGAAVAATLGPYLTLWLLSLTPVVRDPLMARLPQLENLLRTWFGTPDVDAVAYADVQKGMALPRRLPGELREKTQAEQDRIATLNEAPVTVRVRIFSSDNVQPQHEVTTEIMGAQAANAAHMREVLSRYGAKESNGSIALDFKELSSSSSSSQDAALLADSELVFADNQDEGRGGSSVMDPLLHEAVVYSPWYYAAPPATDSSTRQIKQPIAADDHHRTVLEHRLATLQAELRNPNSTRAVDDIVDEIATTKSELRRFQGGWRRWLPGS